MYFINNEHELTGTIYEALRFKKIQCWILYKILLENNWLENTLSVFLKYLNATCHFYVIVNLTINFWVKVVPT